MLKDVKPIGYKWVFNEKNKIVRYIVWWVVQCFMLRSSINYEEIHSPVMDAITFYFLINLIVLEGLYIHLMGVVTTYLYGFIYNDIYTWKSLKDSNCLKQILQSLLYSIKLQQSFYGLKRLRRMWHNHLRKYLLKKRYVNNLTCLCVFIKKLKNDL